MVLGGEQYQDAAVFPLGPYSPLLIKVDGIADHVGAIHRLDRDHGNLGVCLGVDLLADVVELCDCVGVENLGEVIDVVTGMELGDGLGVQPGCHRHENDGQPANFPY